jgi:hypothetical protein
MACAAGPAAELYLALIGLDGKIAHVTDSPSADIHLSETRDAVARPKRRA